MIPPKLTKWRNLERTEGLLIFAQSLCELLFDYTLDSYKAPALNLHTNVIELYILVSQYVDGILKKGSLSFSINELEFNIKNNYIYNNDDRIKLSQYIDKIKENIENKDSILHIVNALQAEISSTYWINLKSKISSCVHNPNEKKLITKLASIFAAELQNIGFTRQYAFAKTKKFFFSSKIAPQVISDCNVIEQFLSIFENTTQQYNIIFRGKFTGQEFFEELIDLAKKLNTEITTSDPEPVSAAQKFIKFKERTSEYNLYFVVSKISAKDIHKAREIAESYLEFIVDVCRFHSHRTYLSFHEDCLGFEDGKANYIIIPKPVKPMECGVLFRQAESKEQIKTTIDILSGVHIEIHDLDSFGKVLDFHHSAMANSDHANQLINLWTALESFLPIPDKNKDRIVSYMGYVLPPLTLTYNKKILSNLLTDIESYDAANRILINVQDGDDNLEKLAFLISSEEYSHLRDELFSSLSLHPLLRFRCFSVSQIFKSTSDILRTNVKHKTKVGYQLQRIYTLRNQIVHKANTFPYIKTLVENLHDYLDTLILSVGHIAKKSSVQIDIATALEILSTRESYYNKILEKNVPITHENCLKFALLYGVY